jgi:NAD(P)-dependent dehydrogenase (short-subunit alcohol dehydrogenase family)
MNANAPLKDISPEEFAHILAVNLGGVHNSIRTFLPAMEDAERGVIVNFSS